MLRSDCTGARKSNGPLRWSPPSLSLRAASVGNTFGVNQSQNSHSLIELNSVVAESSGVVEVYDYHAGQEGHLLRTKPFQAGAHSDLKISLDPSLSNDVLAVLVIDGHAVAQQVVRIDN